MARIAHRRGNKQPSSQPELKPAVVEKIKKEKKKNLLDPRQRIKRTQVNKEDLDQMIDRAKEIIDDQNLITQLQVDIGK